MTDATVVTQYWRDRIARDLSPFSDPGTELLITGQGRSLRALWTARGVDKTATFAISLERGVSVSFSGTTVDYRSFLIGPGMADLPGLAKMILQSRKPGLYVDTQAQTTNGEPAHEGSAVDVLRTLLKEEDPNATKVVIVTGEAGAGKTKALEELVRTQALAFSRAQAARLFLYVNAQGRALARFNEALATELDDLRSLLTYHAVATLTRLGALVPVIDGFDELLGVSGYDDAFSSLAGFIEELDGQGQLVASARSTYYEEEFVARASTVSSLGGQVWVQVPVTIKAWGDAELRDYVQQRAAVDHLDTERSAKLHDELQAVFTGPSADLRQKPLFVSKTYDLLLNDHQLSPGDDLLRQMVDAFVERERHEKLLDQNQRPLLSAAQIKHLMSELAEEMWNQETRELDRRSVREVAEYVMVVDELPETTQRIVIERMPTLPFFAPGERQGGIQFEHEIFFSFFLGRVLARRLVEDSQDVRVFLTRSALPPEVSWAVVRGLAERSDGGIDWESVLKTICLAAAGNGTRANQVKENAGRLVEALLNEAASGPGDPLSDLVIHDVVFPGGELRSVRLVAAIMNAVVFRRTDLTTASFRDCQANGCLLQDVLVDRQRTRLELNGLDPAMEVVGIRVLGLEGGTTQYDPSVLEAVLIDCGTLTPAEVEDDSRRNIAEEPLRLIEKLMRAYGRSNPVCTADDNLRWLFQNREWPRLERLLIEHGIVTEEIRSTGGPAKTFLRRQFLPEQIMTGLDRRAEVPRPVRAFWKAVEAEWAAG